MTILVIASRELFFMLADKNCKEGVEGYQGGAWVWCESERGEGVSLETEYLAIQRQNTRQKNGEEIRNLVFNEDKGEVVERGRPVSRSSEVSKTPHEG